MTACLRNLLVAAAASAGLLGVGAPAAHAEQVYGYIHLTNAYGQPARAMNAVETVVTPGDARSPAQSEGPMPGPGDYVVSGYPGATINVVVSPQRTSYDGGWDGSDCPGLQVARTEITVTLSADESANHWTLQAPRAVPQLTDPGISPAEQRFVDLLNAERARIGVGTVAIAERASAAADAHATAQVTVPGIRAHVGAACEDFGPRYAELGGVEYADTHDDGTTVATAVSEATYQPHSCSSRSPYEALASLLASTNHRNILLDPGAVQVGIANVDGEWTVDMLHAPERVAYALPSLPRTSTNIYCSANPDPADDTPVAEGGSGSHADPRSRLSGVKAVRVRGGKLKVTGRLVPGRASEKITVKVGRKKITVRTTRGGRFSAILRARAHRGTKVTVAAVAHKGVFRATTKTVKAR